MKDRYWITLAKKTDQLATTVVMKHGRGWDQFASEESIYLAHKDPIVNAVKEQSLTREKQAARRRMEWLKNRRIEQSQNLARRKAERETVENVSRAF